MKVGIVKAIRNINAERRRVRGVRDGRLDGWSVADYFEVKEL